MLQIARGRLGGGAGLELTGALCDPVFSFKYLVYYQTQIYHICSVSELLSYGLHRTGSQDHQTHCHHEDKRLQPINRHCQFLW